MRDNKSNMRKLKEDRESIFMIEIDNSIRHDRSAIKLMYETRLLITTKNNFDKHSYNYDEGQVVEDSYYRFIRMDIFGCFIIIRKNRTDVQKGCVGCFFDSCHVKDKDGKGTTSYQVKR